MREEFKAPADLGWLPFALAIFVGFIIFQLVHNNLYRVLACIPVAIAAFIWTRLLDDARELEIEPLREAARAAKKEKELTLYTPICSASPHGPSPVSFEWGSKIHTFVFTNETFGAAFIRCQPPGAVQSISDVSGRLL